MTAVVRGWLGFFALGAGLVHLALAIGSPLAVGIGLVVFGAAELIWGILSLTAVTLPLPRVARVAALMPILAWVALLVVGAAGAAVAIGGLRVLPMLVASLLDLAVAIGITWMLRRDPARRASALRPARYLLGLGTGALVVAALTIPAILATEAGGAATPADGPFEIVLPGTHGSH